MWKSIGKLRVAIQNNEGVLKRLLITNNFVHCKQYRNNFVILSVNGKADQTGFMEEIYYVYIITLKKAVLLVKLSSSYISWMIHSTRGLQ